MTGLEQRGLNKLPTCASVPRDREWPEASHVRT